MTTSNFSGLTLERPLAVRLFKELNGTPLAQEAVLPGDFAEIASEAWRDGCLRAGYPTVPLASLRMLVSPVLAEDSDTRCAGFQINVALPGGKTSRCQFTFQCLRRAAERGAAPLIDAGALESGESYFYEAIVDARNLPSGPSLANESAVNVSFQSKPLAHLRTPLRPLLERSTPVALLDDSAPAVFYTDEALARAEACARRGGNAKIETGGVLLGSLASCPISGEFFTIVHDVIEVQDAEEKEFSLSYSSRTWLRLQKIRDARQAAYPRRAERWVGQAHGHPFQPNDGKTCAECAKRVICTLHSAFASQEDQTWHRAVFARQPWALCHIFGLTARGEPVNQLFGLKDGRLQARGFYVLPGFSFE